MSLPQWRRVAVAVATALLLASCYKPPPPRLMRTNRVSPPPLAAATMPPGSFDHAKAQAELAEAERARRAGDAAAARRFDEAAVAHWPADLGAWTALLADCTTLKDSQCALYAAFFRDKVTFVATVPARVAVLGFHALSEEDEGTTSGNYTFDAATLAMAHRMEAFYNERDPMRKLRWLPDRKGEAKPPP